MYCALTAKDLLQGPRTPRATMDNEPHERGHPERESLSLKSCYIIMSNFNNINNLISPYYNSNFCSSSLFSAALSVTVSVSKGHRTSFSVVINWPSSWRLPICQQTGCSSVCFLYILELMIIRRLPWLLKVSARTSCLTRWRFSPPLPFPSGPSFTALVAYSSNVRFFQLVPLAY